MLVQDTIVEAMRLQEQSIAEGNETKLLQATAKFNEILNIEPNNAQLLFCLGTAYLQQGLSGLAIALYHQALKHIPTSPEIYCNMGAAYKQEQNDDMAEHYYLIANGLKEHTDYLNNLATLYVNRGCPEEGIKYSERAIELAPDNAKAKWNYSLLLLEQGKWKKGFELYREGMNSGDRWNKKYKNSKGNVPLWNGEKGKKVIVYGEQGLGDEIMFASALEELCNDCSEVVFDCHPRLIGLYKRSFSHISNLVNIYPERKEGTSDWDIVENVDYKIPIGDLFYFYRSNGEFPRKPYLVADPERVEMYREYFKSLGDGPYVGIGWIGGYKRTHAHIRNQKLGHLLPILEKDGTFISLQYTDVAGKVERFNREHPECQIHHNEQVVKAFDYDETAAYVEALDHVICINTTVAHLCGAMGKSCWTMTPHERAWRYAAEGEDMYQYCDSIRIIRQEKDGDNDKFIQQIGERYQQWIDQQ